MLSADMTEKRTRKSWNWIPEETTVSRKKLADIGTAVWAIALLIGAVLYITGATPAFASGDLDCFEACDRFGTCDDRGGCVDATPENGDTCTVWCEDGTKKTGTRGGGRCRF